MLQQEKQVPAMSEDGIALVVERIVNGFRQGVRAPILETPANRGLAYENVTFPSEDGTPLEAWFIPCQGSDKLVIANHPRSFNRYGFPSHLDPWKQFGAIGGNDFEVNFIGDYKILHDAGYNVLTYDLRNHGHSGAANGGMPTGGIYESRDVIGSLEYARTSPMLKDFRVALFSRCLGCNSTIFAMARRPEAFEEVKCLIALQPLSPRHFTERFLELSGIPLERMAEIDDGVKLVTSFRYDDFSPVEAAKQVTVPTFMYQVRRDSLTREHDVQAIFDNLASAEKQLFWIEDTTRRWDGYNYFSKDPSKMLAWLNRFMA